MLSVNNFKFFWTGIAASIAVETAVIIDIVLNHKRRKGTLKKDWFSLWKTAELSFFPNQIKLAETQLGQKRSHFFEVNLAFHITPDWNLSMRSAVPEKSVDFSKQKENALPNDTYTSFTPHITYFLIFIKNIWINIFYSRETFMQALHPKDLYFYN